MTDRDDQSIDHELGGVAMAATYEHERTVSAGETEAALGAVRSRIAAGDLGGAPPSIPLTSSSAGRRSPWVRLGAVAAVMAMFALGLVAVVGGGASDTALAPATLPEAASAETVSPSIPASSDPTATTSDTTAATTTTTSIPAASPTSERQVISVDAAAPPRLVEPVPYFTLPLEPNPNGQLIEFAVGSDHVVVNQPGTQSITIVGPDVDGISAREVPIEENLASIASGPGPVVYGFGELAFDEGEQTPRALRLVAIPFLGENEGQVVAVEEVALSLEVPPYYLGHGPDGIVARNAEPTTLIGYVDEQGAPRGSGEDEENGNVFPVLALGDTSNGAQPVDENIISVQNSDVSWQLDIARDPAWAGFPFNGRSVVAPGSSRAIYTERIGASTRPDLDFGPNSTPVVALLNYDGSGEWIRLPEDWDVVASDVWGTLLARVTDDSIELASLDDLVPPTGPSAPAAPSPAPPQPASTTTIVEATTTTSLLVDPGDGLVQPTAIARTCLGESDDCTQLALAENGRIVGLDQVDNALRVFDASGTELQADVPILEPLESPFLWAVGPDDVAYVQLVGPGSGESGSELLAIPLVGSNAGSVVMRWTGLDGTGDSTLIPRKTGLTVVPCCGGDGTRPSLDASIYRWVDRNGETVSSTAPSFDLNLGSEANSLTRIDSAEDGSPAFTRFSLPIAYRFPRDFPLVVATDDGGALAYDFVQTISGGVEVFVDFDTDWPTNGVAGGDVYYRDVEAPGGRPILEPSGTVLEGVDGGFVRRELDQVASKAWPGEHELLDDRTTIVADGLNDFIDATSPAWAADAELFGYQIVQSVGPGEQIQVSVEDGAAPVVVVEATGLLDDSVAATQHRIMTERGSDGLLRFVSGTYGFRCVEGRGHQDFSVEPCI